LNIVKKGIFLVTLLTVLIMVLAACNASTSSSSASDKSITDLNSNSGYPERPIDIIIPYAAGGGTDVQARIIAKSLQEQLGQTVNVVAKPGGAGAVGMNQLKSSKNDGHTIILTAVGPSTLTPNHSDVGYKAPEDFEVIAQITELPYAFAVHKDSGIETLEELLDYAKENLVTYGTTGAGLHQHVIMSEFFSNFDDINVEHIPFQGGAEAVNALLGKHSFGSANVVSEILPHYEAGTINILGVFTKERLDILPDVPTFNESGYDLIGGGAWFGFMAPKGTPEDIIKTLEEAIKKALDDPGLQEQFAKAGFPIAFLGSETFRERVTSDNELNAKVIEGLSTE
jgi:tripartite-type tricarboxylate transporter receptor subunit TctC